jgi:hypothetical protein
MRGDKTGDVVGRTNSRSSFLGDPGAKFLCGKPAIGTKKEKMSNKRERPVGTVGSNQSFTGGTNVLEELGARDRLRVGFWASVGSSTTANALLVSSNASEGHFSEYATIHPSRRS